MNSFDANTIVGVRPADALVEHRPLFAALEAATAVRFVRHPSDQTRVAGLLVVGQDHVPADAEVADAGLPMLVFSASSPLGNGTCDLRLADHAGVDRCLQGIVLRSQVRGGPLRLTEADQPLALSPEAPLWTRRAGPPRVEHVAAPLPALVDGRTLIETLHGGHALGLVALLRFVRALDPHGWSSPGLRCAFVLDDPNLRRNRYGYVNYRQLVSHADDWGYHIAIAMVPLDARHWCDGAVATFRARPDRLSLVMHGNDHARGELTGNLGFRSALAPAAQALRRMAWFERETGLLVDRVMMPPREEWSALGARALGALGYAGLCACHTYPSTGGPPPQRVLADWAPAAFVDGCAVLPRFPLSLDRTGIALRAFLGHPLVLYGHHDDLASGLEPLAAAAALVNGLGDVRWCSMGEIVLSNRELRVDDGTINVRPWGQQLRLDVPDGVHHVTVREPISTGTTSGLSGWTASGVGGHPLTFGDAAPVSRGEVVVRLHAAWETDPRGVVAPRRSLSAVGRRRMSEVRDHLVAVGRPHSAQANPKAVEEVPPSAS